MNSIGFVNFEDTDGFSLEVSTHSPFGMFREQITTPRETPNLTLSTRTVRPVNKLLPELDRWVKQARGTEEFEGRKQAAKEIRKNLRSKDRFIDLSNLKLTSLPPEIARLKHLVVLKLENNRLSSLPKEIENLTNLQEIDLSNNHFTTIPNELTRIENLKTLNMKNNKISSIPDQIFQHQELNILDLRDNPVAKQRHSEGQKKLFSGNEINYSNLPKNVSFQTIKAGSQDGKIGSIQRELAEDYCEALDEKKEETGIAFKKDRIVDHLEGGTCSAMSFDFIYRYLQNSHLPPETIIEKISHKFEQSSEDYRTIQSVFNSLCRDCNQEDFDFHRAKIDAMLRFFDRYVDEASEPFEIPADQCMMEDSPLLTKLEKILERFQEGVFVVRCILPEENDKGEDHGHSTVLIRDRGSQYFYDPNQGVLELENGFEAPTLHHILSDMSSHWTIPLGRMYRVR